MAGHHRLAACAAVAVHLCLLLSPAASLRWLSDEPQEASASAGGANRYGSARTAYHFQPAKNWQNGRNIRTLVLDYFCLPEMRSS